MNVNVVKNDMTHFNFLLVVTTVALVFGLCIKTLYPNIHLFTKKNNNSKYNKQLFESKVSILCFQYQ